MPANKPRLINDIRRWTLDGLKDQPCKVIELRHLNSNEAAAGVGTWEIKKRDTDLTPEKLAKDIIDAAENDAQDLEGPQKYVVLAYFGTNEKPQQRHGFSITSPMIMADSDDISASEPANAKGIGTMLMRHLENREKGTMGMIMHMFQMFRNENENIREQNQMFAEKHLETMTLVEELISLKDERDGANEDRRRSAATKQQIAEKAMQFLPSVVNRLTGTKMLPEASATVETEMIYGVLESLTPEQFEGLSKVLTPHQLMPVMELIKRRMDVEDQKKAEEAKTQSNVAPIRVVKDKK